MIEAFSLNQGSLTLVSGTPFQTGINPYGLAIAPGGGFLYTANTGENSISEFTIQSNGSLVPITGSPIGEIYSTPVSLLINKSGAYLYVANQGSSNLSAYSIGSDGSLNGLATSPFAAASQPSVMATDSGGKYLFVGNQSSPVIQSFSLDSGTGTLTSVTTYSVPGTPTSIATTR
jgi:6-phosphogluconolactonase (cycloisomerase 2 family)